MERLPKTYRLEKEKAKEIERREKALEEWQRKKKEAEIERMQRYLQRSQAPAKKRVGKQVSLSSAFAMVPRLTRSGSQLRYQFNFLFRLLSDHVSLCAFQEEGRKG